MVAVGALAALQPRNPSAAAALGVEVREAGTALAGDGVVELEEGWRKVGAAEGRVLVVCVDWLVG